MQHIVVCSAPQTCSVCILFDFILSASFVLAAYCLNSAICTPPTVSQIPYLAFKVDTDSDCGSTYCILNRYCLLLELFALCVVKSRRKYYDEDKLECNDRSWSRWWCCCGSCCSCCCGGGWSSCSCCGIGWGSSCSCCGIGWGRSCSCCSIVWGRSCSYCGICWGRRWRCCGIWLGVYLWS